MWFRDGVEQQEAVFKDGVAVSLQTIYYLIDFLTQKSVKILTRFFLFDFDKNSLFHKQSSPVHLAVRVPRFIVR